MNSLQAWEQIFYVRDGLQQSSRLRPIILKALQKRAYFKTASPKIILICGQESAEIAAHLLQRLGIVHGEHVGLFLSNFLLSLNEQIRVDGKRISPAELSALLEKNRELGEELKLNGAESLLLAALDYFDQKSTSLVIIESGLMWDDPAIEYLRSDLLLMMEESREVSAKTSYSRKFNDEGATSSFSRPEAAIVAIRNPAPTLKKSLTQQGIRAFWLGQHWQLTEDSPESCVLTGIKRQRYLFSVGQYDAYAMASAIVAWEGLYEAIAIEILLKAIAGLDISGSFHEISLDPVMIVDHFSTLNKMRVLARRLIALEEKKYLRGWNLLFELPEKIQNEEQLEIFKSYPNFSLHFFHPIASEQRADQLPQAGLITPLCLVRRQNRRRVAKALHQIRLDALLNKKGVFVLGSFKFLANIFAVIGINAQQYCPSHCSTCPKINA